MSVDRGQEVAAYARAQVQHISASARVTYNPEEVPGYTLLSELHRGGQGTVYLAYHHTAKRRVAIKIWHSAGCERSDHIRFKREVVILGQVRHPNVVTVHDGGVAPSTRPYLVMDLINGGRLDEYVTQHRLSIHDTIRLFAKVCSAVSAVHARGIIHRDLKPSNIRVDSSGEPHLLDFGLAKVFDDDEAGSNEGVTATAAFIGSLFWTSPEQAAGKNDQIDQRSDVYALGVILFQVLTESLPYGKAKPWLETLQRIVSGEPARPSSIRRKIDDDLDTIILKCLSKEPTRRYQTVEALSRDLELYLAGRPIDAKSDSNWYVLSKTLRRHRVPVTAALSLVCILAIGFVTISTLYVRSIAAERESRERSEQLQAMARSFVQDFDDKIRKGPTTARKYYVEMALPYLELLAKRREPDAVADALAGYVKVADVQGNASYANLGDAAEAMRTLKKAKDLAEAALNHASPLDKSQIEFQYAMVLERIGDLKFYLSGEQITEAIATFEQCLRLRRELLASSPQNSEYLRGVSTVLLRLGNMHLEQHQVERASGFYAESVSYSQEYLDLNRDNVGASVLHERCLRAVGDGYYALGKVGLAIDQFEQAQRQVTFLANDGDADAQHELIRLSLRLGNAYTDLKDHQKALESYIRCEEIATSFEGVDPNDVRAIDDRLHCSQSVAMSYLRLGNFEEAIRRSNSGLDLARAIALRTPDTKGGQRNVAHAFNQLGCIYKEVDRLDEALQCFDEAIERYEGERARDSGSIRVFHALGNCYMRRGEIQLALATSASGTEERLKLLTHSRCNLEDSAAIFETLRQRGSLSPKHAQRPMEVEGLTAQVDEETSAIQER